MNDDIDRISRDLAVVLDRLNALPSDAFADRFRLLTRQDELRAEAAEYRDDLDAARPVEELHAELDSLRKLRNQLIETRIGFATGKGGSNHGPASAAMVKLGVKAMGAAHLDRIHARISQLEDLLEASG